MSLFECDELDRPQTSRKRPLESDEDDVGNLCCCFEKSACVVRLLRAKRLKDSSSVRRKLDFGPAVDSETGISDPLLQQVGPEASEIWNFDFEEEKPLEGNWLWVQHSEDVQPVSCTTEGGSTSGEMRKHRTLKDLFKVSKNRRSGKASKFLRPLAPIRTTEATSA